ncbi:glycoside hydrolase family 95 protein [Dothidotthia symphoricarpi CBS 119687]|uniref:Glycoside hydrolase family 95 protein n=1 Tax=Dothidotthia symphoricarpi CBS 119687 TaxID=1392245 RepID=A0A6A6A9M8_9PLEO|nr:glycoside hydrolase family 95 protein [Dothidotthia symphoricarpi CBS 119687]KAF2128266.1 glycoside hydrolase family 95 protein [Dothidotthia symphoricarpi CBS 119687]
MASPRRSPWPKRHFLVVSLLAITHRSNARSFWSTSPANASDIIRSAYPLGNGRLGAMPYGPAGSETVNLNLDSLWSGGPFESANYTGGNPSSAVAPALSDIRSWIFTNGTGNVTELLGSDGEFGSYRVLGNLSVSIPSISALDNETSVTNYTRTLNLSNGVHTTRFSKNDVEFETSVFCSFPDQVCVYAVEASDQLPMLEVRLDNELVEAGLQDVACIDSTVNGTAHVRLRGLTQLGPPEGMRYDAIARVLSSTSVQTLCHNGTGILSVIPGNGTRSVAIVVGAGTNYDAKKGTAEFNYSFRGEDPGPAVEKTTKEAASKTFAELKDNHVQDFEALTGRFSLSLSDPLNSAETPTEEVIARYSADNPSGDPYLENLLFDYANYMFISSSRPGSLPPNLQGRWSEGLWAAWSGDYHTNINIQMNHWTAEQAGLTDLQSPLWDYMSNTWFPRGHETAELLYGAPGWVVHNEINIFGHTGMKSGASWANYAAAAAWMMQHVFDHWDYTRDAEWLRSQGYPMLQGVAEFWLNQLQEDTFSGDGTLVVNPCNSPEHGPTTFGCAHFQQLVHQVFDATLSIGAIADTEGNSTFLANVSSSLAILDKGFHIGEWGQIKEWKIPDSYGYEFINDTHRHLSELVGWYPGYSLSSFMGGYTNATIQDAVAQKLYSRGEGNAEDANAGWAKVWRSACWARLNNTERAHFELRYAIDQNFAANGFSMYSGTGTPFQIDANFGIGGAVLSMLVVDLPAAYGDESTRTVVLGPAIPEAWAGGEVKGLRLRGGGFVDFGWDDKGVVTKATLEGRTTPLRVVNRDGTVLFEG